MPYTKAKERYFPSPEPGTPEDIKLLQEIRDLLAAGNKGSLTADPSETCDGSAVVRRHLRAQPVVAVVASARADDSSSRSSLVVSGSTSPNTAASRRRRSSAVSAWPRASCCSPVMRRARVLGSSAEGPDEAPFEPPPDPPFEAPSEPPFEPESDGDDSDSDALPEPGGTLGAGRLGGVDRTAGQPLRQRLVGGDPLPELLGLGQPRDPTGVLGALVVLPRHGDELDVVEPDVLELQRQVGDLRDVRRGPCRRSATWSPRRGTAPAGRAGPACRRTSPC